MFSNSMNKFCTLHCRQFHYTSYVLRLQFSFRSIILISFVIFVFFKNINIDNKIVDLYDETQFCLFSLFAFRSRGTLTRIADFHIRSILISLSETRHKQTLKVIINKALVRYLMDKIFNRKPNQTKLVLLTSG